MKPIMQNKFYDRVKDIRGNCMTACVASILELPIHEVPNFHDMKKTYTEALVEFIGGLDKDIIYHGANDMPSGYCIATGPSPRDASIYHVVIMKDGEYIHDPHPDSTFILSVSGYYTIESDK